MHSSVTEKKVNPYTKLACVYDYLMSHVNYELWSVFIYRILRQVNIKSGSIMDISCGTGSLLQNLLSDKFYFYGSDSSVHMLKVAKKKINVPLFCMDIASFITKQRFDVVLCLYDSINYLIKKRRFLDVLKNVYEIISPGGIFIFDISTEINSLKYFDNCSDSDTFNNFVYWRYSEYLKESQFQINRFRIKDKTKQKIYVEEHIQKIYRLEEIENFIDETKFNLLYKLDGFTFNEGSETSDRVHFVLQK